MVRLKFCDQVDRMFGREKEQGKNIGEEGKRGLQQQCRGFEMKRTDEGQLVREVEIREDTTIPEIASSIISISQSQSQNLKGTFSPK